ncbi:MAG: hypothetical protein K0R39_317 [Symbiobacteriaceae bacterium]|jgi:hypothetical protein|nr:hypothetical protein [Symbiobacteriaceae bacterium]
MNFLQSLFQSANQPPTPPTIGEAFNVWTYYVAAKECRTLTMMMSNHTNDIEQKQLIEHLISEVLEPQIKQMTDFLRNEGIPMPPGSGDKPKANEQQIPPGAKMTDDEIANMVLLKTIGLLSLCHLGLAQGLRDDIGSMFYNFQAHVLAHSYNLKKTMQKRGWMLVPPFYYASHGVPR